MRFELLLLVAIAVGWSSCAGRKPVLHPVFADGGMLKDATPLSKMGYGRLGAMYTSSPAALLGAVVAAHGAAGTISLFGAKANGYAILRGGCIDGGAKLVLEGHWRYPSDVETGLVRLFVEPPEVAAAICADREPGAPVTLTGTTGSESNDPQEPLTFTFDKPLAPLGRRFFIVGHHGACRTIDDCGASENSVESIKLAESMGATVVEIDVRLTADGVPILFHDDTFGPRLTNGEYCHGDVSSFTLAHVRALCTLKYGEVIPTLDEALAAVLEQTSVTGVWLDIKVPEAVGPSVALARQYNARVAENRPAMRVIIGIGDEDVMDAFQAAAPDSDTPCLVELEPDDVRRLGCEVWGPRWTRGPMVDDVAALQKDGIAVAFWTMDEPEYIDLFLTKARPNAILSDRPGLVFQRAQVNRDLLLAPDGGLAP